MPPKQTPTRSIQLSKSTLTHIAYVFHEADYVHHQRHKPEYQKAYAQIDAFGDELLNAIAQHPTADPRNVLDCMWSRDRSVIEVEIDEHTLIQFLTGCTTLDSGDAVVRHQPFFDMITHSERWFPEDPEQISN